MRKNAKEVSIIFLLPFLGWIRHGCSFLFFRGSLIFIRGNAPVHFGCEMLLAKGIAAVLASIQCLFATDGALCACHVLGKGRIIFKVCYRFKYCKPFLGILKLSLLCVNVLNPTHQISASRILHLHLTSSTEWQIILYYDGSIRSVPGYYATLLTLLRH